MQLITRPNFKDPAKAYPRDYGAGDEFYELLTDAHRGLNEGQSAKFNAKLILLLANHVGDLPVLREAIAIASGTGTVADPR